MRAHLCTEAEGGVSPSLCSSNDLSSNASRQPSAWIHCPDCSRAGRGEDTCISSSCHLSPKTASRAKAVGRGDHTGVHPEWGLGSGQCTKDTTVR
jgi:hypothetical protein